MRSKATPSDRTARLHIGAGETVPLPLHEALDRLEREIIRRALEETKHVKARAARRLGISERSLWYKLHKHGLS